MQVDTGKTIANDVMQIGDVNVDIKDIAKGPIVVGNQVNSSIQKSVMGNDHEASSSSSTAKYFQPRWCPPRLTRTQKRKLQRLRFQEKREQELEKQRDEQFNKYRPMIPQGKVWKVKAAGQPAGPVEPP
ncbi:hypothetical protein GQ55_1G259600 [Panicum hallii var. hallii]|uniref:Uncharacterized protein n=1 Tax=Panicum hallii var. hallii TaxID=1504633 RepID=A0A2T7F7J1_9POAL|nr:hypothetical protein GQ55_1G259600 [Panicum hallii var. hallii]